MQPTDFTTENATQAQKLVSESPFSFRMIGGFVGVNKDTVQKALDPERFDVISHGRLMRIRKCIVALLKASGTKVDDSIWAEYERKLNESLDEVA